MMLGRRAPIYFMIMWCGFSPLLMAAVLVFTAVQYQPLEFQGWVYTPGFTAVGWMIVVFCVIFIPGMALIQVCYRGGDYEALKRAANPLEEWGPANSADRVGTKYARAGDPGYLQAVDNSDELPPPEPDHSPMEAYTNGYNSYTSNEKGAKNDGYTPDEPAPPYEEAASKL